ncbi:MAG: DNA-directed RNA polymerase subunit omega [Ruminococcaceae bacterium]|nr:DNA-directed RNA polymerase subunit omega [Oscillospiraceae bacterium]
MMLYPTVQDLTNDKVNRYKLVIATAKCARHLIDKANDVHEHEEMNKTENDRYITSKEPKNEYELLLTEKPVSVAVMKLYDGEYSIVDNK